MGALGGRCGWFLELLGQALAEHASIHIPIAGPVDQKLSVATTSGEGGGELRPRLWVSIVACSGFTWAMRSVSIAALSIATVSTHPPSAQKRSRIDPESS